MNHNVSREQVKTILRNNVTVEKITAKIFALFGVTPLEDKGTLRVEYFEYNDGVLRQFYEKKGDKTSLIHKDFTPYKSRYLDPDIEEMLGYFPKHIDVDRTEVEENFRGD